MKSSASKPISSPGRADKYPPPLMRFLRGNVGSKSRVRSRAVPLFTRRKRAAAAIDAQQQEPSSPKVTCIGQVRVRRSSSKSKSGIKNRDPQLPLRRRSSSSSTSNPGAGNWFCFWTGKPSAKCCSFRFSLCCRRRRQPPWLRRCVSSFRCRSVRVRTDSPKKRPNPTGSGQIFYSDTRSESFEVEDEDEEGELRESSGQANGSDPSTKQPKNALLLTRCRSTPHRSSLLAGRIWGSPSKTGEQENRVTTAEEAGPSSGIDPIQIETAAKSRIDREKESNLEIRKSDTRESETVGSSKETKTTHEGGGEEEKQSKERIVVLTRCKSEPARRSGDPLTGGFWRERRLESPVSCRNYIESK